MVEIVHYGGVAIYDLILYVLSLASDTVFLTCRLQTDDIFFLTRQKYAIE